MRFGWLALAVALVSVPSIALADGGGPPSINVAKAQKKGAEPATKAGASETAGHEIHVSSAKQGGARVDFNLYLYDITTGKPLKSAEDKVVCNPCTYGVTEVVTQISLDRLMADKGGFPKETPKAIGVYTVGSDEVEDVSVSWIKTGNTALSLELYHLKGKHFDKATK